MLNRFIYQKVSHFSFDDILLESYKYEFRFAGQQSSSNSMICRFGNLTGNYVTLILINRNNTCKYVRQMRAHSLLFTRYADKTFTHKTY